MVPRPLQRLGGYFKPLVSIMATPLGTVSLIPMCLVS